MVEFFVPKNVRRFKSIRHFKTPSGSHVIVLPTCTVPLEHLVEHNWDEDQRHSDVGSSRQVRSINNLRNGAPIMDNQGALTVLYVKSPEREFVANVKYRDPFIWSGENETGQAIIIKPGDVRVEKQAVWEARILLGLLKKRIHAEAPQAIVIHKDGRREVITRDISPVRRLNRKESADEDSFFELGENVDLAGFETGDFDDRNVLVDKRGKLHIIDVNRWLWPPYTNHYNDALVKAVHEAVRKESWVARLARLNKPRARKLQAAAKKKISRALQKLRMWKNGL